MVEVPDKGLHLPVPVVIQKQPIQLLGIPPLNELGKFVAHKAELFARVGHHVGVHSPQIAEFLVVLPGHFVDEGGLSMDHLVMRQGENEVL